MSAPIRIATALIDDGEGRIFLVRKRGTSAFMQPGGKIGPGETPLEALVRELDEELSFSPRPEQIRFLGFFAAPAANEPDCFVEAHAFHMCCPSRQFTVAAELDEGLWVTPDEAGRLPLAPLIREQILPLARTLGRGYEGRVSAPLDGPVGQI